MNVKIKAGTKPQSIIFLHGNSSSSKVYADAIDHLSVPYNLITIDFYGHGESEHNGRYHIQQLKEDLIKTISSIDGEKLIAGNSLGGHLAIESAERINQLKGLVIFGAPPVRKPINLEEAFPPNPYMETFFQEQPSAEELEISLKAMVQNKQVLPLLTKDFLATDPKVRSSIAESLTNPEVFINEAKYFCEADLNKRIIYGENDPTVNIAYLNKLKEEAKIPFETIGISNCGHYPSLEQPQVFSGHLNRIAKATFEP